MTWMQTASGKVFDFGDLSNNEYSVDDIATHLSKICRFNGAVKGNPYCVAQHSIHVALHVSSKFSLEGLMHDSAEAYIGDPTRPFKQFLGPAYKKVESAIEEEIAKRFGLQYPWPDEIKVADTRMLATEQRDLLKPCDREWEATRDIEPYPFTLDALNWRQARTWFLETFAILMKRRNPV